jgi:hypothetical protein
MIMKVKYSEINASELFASDARNSIYLLLKNGYIKIGAYYEIETMKLIKCLKVLGIKHNINYIDSNIPNSQGDYEFTLDFFEDDRNKKETIKK